MDKWASFTSANARLMISITTAFWSALCLGGLIPSSVLFFFPPGAEAAETGAARTAAAEVEAARAGAAGAGAASESIALFFGIQKMRKHRGDGALE